MTFPVLSTFVPSVLVLAAPTHQGRSFELKWGPSAAFGIGSLRHHKTFSRWIQVFAVHLSCKGMVVLFSRVTVPSIALGAYKTNGFRKFYNFDSSKFPQLSKNANDAEVWLRMALSIFIAAKAEIFEWVTTSSHFRPGLHSSNQNKTFPTTW